MILNDPSDDILEFDERPWFSFEIHFIEALNKFVFLPNLVSLQSRVCSGHKSPSAISPALFHEVDLRREPL